MTFPEEAPPSQEVPSSPRQPRSVLRAKKMFGNDRIWAFAPEFANR